MLTLVHSVGTNILASLLGVAMFFYLIVMFVMAVISFTGGIAKGYLLMKNPEDESDKVKYSLQ